MAIKRTYRKATETQANFDFTDLASGNAFTSFYGTQIKSTAGTSYAFVTNTPFSSATDVNQTQGTLTLTFNSAPFNLARTVKGTATFNAGVYSNNAANWLWAQLSKVKPDGTQINITGSHAYQTASEIKKILIEMPVPVEVKVDPGEKLRFVVSLVTPGGGGDNTAIGVDPQARAGAYMQTASGADTKMEVQVPFKIVL